MSDFIERDRRDDDNRHGTTAGATRHVKAGEPPCDACRAAKAEYDKRRLEADDKTRLNRLHAKAQAMAERDLRRSYPDEYRVLYVSHKQALLDAAKATR